MLKIISKITIATLAIFTGAMTPMGRFAKVEAASDTKYISEVKVGMDKTEAGAVKELLEEGYTILSENGKYADLNEDAGSDASMARGQKKVYLGYKTTNNPKEAITDLAVMNMRGGYSVKDYEALMETKLKTQVLPFIDRFIVTLDEYRENLNSPYPANKARAEYMKTMLNKLQDDDTGGLLGDLLVNETKYEMGDTAYNALSDEEKKQHADIATIIMQANGKSTLSMETLLTKATDTDETSWIDRLENTTLDDLKDELIVQGVDIADVDTTLDRRYGDDANKLLEKWEVFSKALFEYDDKANELANIDTDYYDEMAEIINEADPNSKDIEKNGEAVVANLELQEEVASATLDLELVAAHDRLEEVYYDFEDGTNLAEFFAQDASVFNGDGIRNLYPVVASLSAGQLAGLDFLSIQDLVTIATADATSYESKPLGDIDPASIYEGVNREIFEKGKVALTNKALRAEAMKNDVVVDHPLSASTYILWGATAIATAGMVASYAVRSAFNTALDTIETYSFEIREYIDIHGQLYDIGEQAKKGVEYFNSMDDDLFAALKELVGEKNAQTIIEKGSYTKTVTDLMSKSKIATYLSAAFTVAMAALAIASIVMTVLELINYYKVEYSPIPKYIVEETEITKTENGITTVERNDSAYYRVAECNRKPSDDFYDVLQNYADLNGDVGKQWLALYYVRQEGHAPIKADSLKVVKGTSNIPTGYTELGIHNFETKVAYNLTSEYYCYNDATNGTYVYYQVDEAAVANASTAGSNFSTGTGFLFGGVGAVIGAGIGVAIMLLVTKKKEIKVEQE